MALYRPKISKKTYGTVGRYSKYITQFIDKNDYGLYKKHVNNKKYINYCISNGYTYHTLKTRKDYKVTYTKGKSIGYGISRREIMTIDDVPVASVYSSLFKEQFNSWIEHNKVVIDNKRDISIERHLDSASHNDRENLVYYTSSYNKQYNLLALDFDYCSDDILLIISFLSRIFKNSYYERTNKGLHFYILVKYLYKYDFLDDEYSNEKEAIYRNTLVYLLVLALSEHLSCLDRPKGTCGVYNSNSELLKCGDLCSLPACSSYSDYHRFYNCSIYDELQLVGIINWLNEMTCRYSDYYDVISLKDVISSYCSDVNDYTFAINSKYINSLNSLLFSQKNNLDIKCPTTISLGNRVGVSSKGNDFDICDTFTQELKYISSYIYEVGLKNVNKDKCYERYILETGYNKIDTNRMDRFYNIYEYALKSYDGNKRKSKSYKLGKYIDRIEWDDKELTEWVKSETSYKRNIYRIDLDIALGYIGICSLESKRASRLRAISRVRSMHGIDDNKAKELLKNTCPYLGLCKFFEWMKEDKISYNGKRLNKCDNKKSKALFDILLHLDLIECIDDNYSVGISRKYRIKEK